MAIHQATKNKIIDLYFKKHIPIREIAKITKKSSRDITAILKEQKGKSSTQAYEVDNKEANPTLSTLLTRSDDV